MQSVQTPPHLKKGSTAERDAEQLFASRSNARLIARNLRFKVGEIDLVFEEEKRDGSVELVFIEVRSRRAGNRVSGVDSVDFSKRRRLSRAIDQFLIHYRGPAKSARFDLMAQDGDRWTHLVDVRLD